MTLTEVYREIDRNDIDVYYFPMESNAKGIALPDGSIAIDTDKIENDIEEKEVAYHECAHIKTGSFYNLNSPFDIKEKQEKRAWKETIITLVPLDEFTEAINSGITECWELAELFEVSEDLMQKAMEMYYNVVNSIE